MNATAPLTEETATPLRSARPDAATHFRLSLFGVVTHLIEEYADGDLDEAFKAQPFLAEYYAESARLLGVTEAVASTWRRALRAWERDAPELFPVLALREAGLDTLDLELLLATGLVEEDPRFGEVFGHAHRPTFGILLACWRTDASGEDRLDAVRDALNGLVRAGLLTVVDASLPRPDWVLAVPAAIWAALRGDSLDLPWLRHVRREKLTPLEHYVAPAELSEICIGLPEALTAEPQQLVLLRGPRHNGRKTLAGAVARQMGKSLLIAGETVSQDETQWRQLMALASMMSALPVVELELAPGVSRTLPPPSFNGGPIFIVTGTSGAVAVADSRTTINVLLPLPPARLRTEHWVAALSDECSPSVTSAATSLRMTSGNIRRAARAARSIARLARRNEIQLDDLRLACRALQVNRLETLATYLKTEGTLSDLVVNDPTREELQALIARCRHRERLAEESPRLAGRSVGVRALFVGASGTGKTLAARLLAATLGKDVYCIDLAATVNKYIGETEKNLDRALAAAEELDVVLLLDEGDALMATRTDVSSSNDRYANLETNFLLQRIESFTGILLVTSNAANRIDKAFSRRMDVIVHFSAPDEWGRYEILRRHLQTAPSISAEWLQEVACRCALSGGQLRNIASHAALLALEQNAELNDDHLYAALAREYRKSGGQCPVRRPRVRVPGS